MPTDPHITQRRSAGPEHQVVTMDAEIQSDPDDAEIRQKHADLVLMADKWLWRQNCGVVFRDAFRPSVYSGERPDAIGWRHGISILVECKASRADFFADRSKPFRINPIVGAGDWRFYLSPKGVISPTELPTGWGLLYANGKRIEPVCGVPGNTGWFVNRPFVGAKESEVQMLYAALRRMVLRGHFDTIYEPMTADQSRPAPADEGEAVAP